MTIDPVAMVTCILMMILNQRSIPIASGVILNFAAVRDGQSAREVYVT